MAVTYVDEALAVVLTHNTRDHDIKTLAALAGIKKGRLRRLLEGRKQFKYADVVNIADALDTEATAIFLAAHRIAEALADHDEATADEIENA